MSRELIGVFLAGSGGRTKNGDQVGGLVKAFWRALPFGCDRIVADGVVLFGSRANAGCYSVRFARAGGSEISRGRGSEFFLSVGVFDGCWGDGDDGRYEWERFHR